MLEIAERHLWSAKRKQVEVTLLVPHLFCSNEIGVGIVYLCLTYTRLVIT